MEDSYYLNSCGSLPETWISQWILYMLGPIQQLGWMKIPIGKLKTYVFYGVPDTINRITLSNLRYVNSNHNPADLVSRGIYPEDLLYNNWLSQSPAWWPRLPDIAGSLYCQNSNLMFPMLLLLHKSMTSIFPLTEGCAE